MYFQFDEEQMVESATRFLEKEGGKMNHLKLVKLLYIADRLAIYKYGSPIIGGRNYSLPFGPVSSEACNIVRDQVQSSLWNQFVERDSSYVIKLKSGESFSGIISDADIEIIDEVYAKYGQMDRFQLSEYTHQYFKEWKEPGGGSIPITYKDMLSAMDLSEEDVKNRLKDIKSALTLDSYSV